MPNEPTDKPSYLNQSYREMRRAWRVVDDVAQGTLRLRAAGSEYLPMEPAEDERDFKIRLERAIFFNAFERSLHGLVGMVFRKEPRLGQDVSEFIRGSTDTEGIAENIDNVGTHWTVFSKEIFTDAMRQGHAAILVDMPSGPAYAYEIARGRKRPYWIGYRADQILNWRSTVVSGRTVLDQVTLRECGYEADGMFGEKEVTRYRVLRRATDPATDLPVIAWTIYREVEQEGKETLYVIDREGILPLPEIPLALISIL